MFIYMQKVNSCFFLWAVRLIWYICKLCLPLLSCSRVTWLIFIISGIYSTAMYFFWSAVFWHLFDFPSTGHICMLPLPSKSIRHQTIPSFMKPYFKFWLCHSKYRYFRLDLICKFYKHILSSLSWLHHSEIIKFITL